MKNNTCQQTVEFRNLLFTIGVLAVFLFFLAFFLEKRQVSVQPEVSDLEQAERNAQVREKKSEIPRTTFRIQPLVTRFPPLPDFSVYSDVDQRKAAFIDYLTPIIEYQNDKILRERRHLEQILKKIVNGELLPDDKRSWLQRLSEKYDVEWNEEDPVSVIVKLARRVDIIPVSLAIVQAAKESSWGRSRYAVEGNNLFGQWCYDEGCGVVPEARDPDAVHEVRRFKTVNDAARSYLLNLNTHQQYATLRQIRQHLRVHKRPVTGKALAEGLLHYSQRREAYVEEVKSMLRQYTLFQERRTG